MPPEAIQRADRALIDAAARRILIVEDNQVSSMILSAMLRKAGWEPISAVDGAEGLAMSERFEPRLILMDLQMPRLDGYAATREILRTGRQRDYAPTIIAVTAAPDTRPSESWKELGFAALIEKPIDMSELLAVIRRYLEPGSD